MKKLTITTIIILAMLSVNAGISKSNNNKQIVTNEKHKVQVEKENVVKPIKINYRGSNKDKENTEANSLFYKVKQELNRLEKDMNNPKYVSVRTRHRHRFSSRGFPTLTDNQMKAQIVAIDKKSKALWERVKKNDVATKGNRNNFEGRCGNAFMKIKRIKRGIK